jgi:Tfp pilus assembly protein PilO
MDPQVLIWALLTGGITGATWIGILALQRHEKMLERQRKLTDELQQRLAALEQVEGRLLEAEERLDFTERSLVRDAARQRLPRTED